MSKGVMVEDYALTKQQQVDGQKSFQPQLKSFNQVATASPLAEGEGKTTGQRLPDVLMAKLRFARYPTLHRSASLFDTPLHPPPALIATSRLSVSPRYF